MIPYQIFVVV